MRPEAATYVRHVGFHRFSLQYTASCSFLVFFDFMRNFFQFLTAEFVPLTSLTEMTKSTDVLRESAGGRSILPGGGGGFFDRGDLARPSRSKPMIHLDEGTLRRALHGALAGQGRKGCGVLRALVQNPSV